MSSQPRAEFIEEELSEQTVHDYLADHPDFFERHPKLLGSLHLPHASGGAVSLVERQVSVLRARINDVLAAKIHALTLQLLAAADLDRTVAVVEEAMRTGFDADQAVLVLFGDSGSFDDVSAGRFFRVVEKDDPALKPFSTFLNGSSARCGKIRDSQRAFLFRDDAEEIGSAALVPLGDGAEVGFLAVGSVSSERFHPGMRIDFLTRIGELVAGSLQRF
jgi:uncharacterized protein YigA (DUF484 family)